MGVVVDEVVDVVCPPPPPEVVAEITPESETDGLGVVVDVAGREEVALVELVRGVGVGM